MSTPSHHSERVLVVPSAAFDRLGRFQGYCAHAHKYLDALLIPELVDYRPRSEVEDDPSLKQIIPYVVFISGDLVFCYTRGKKQSEARLHRLLSLGVGGHVAEEDTQGGKTRAAYESALRRELDEEVAIESPGKLECIGLINDDSNPVGQVHLGVVHVYLLEEPKVSPKESGLAEPRFVELSDLEGMRDQFETWSQICINSFLPRYN